MADGIADQRLPPQQQEIARQGAGDGGQHTDQQRRQGQRDEFSPHHDTCGFWARSRSSVAIWSGVSTVSMGDNPS